MWRDIQLEIAEKLLTDNGPHAFDIVDIITSSFKEGDLFHHLQVSLLKACSFVPCAHFSV